ncbi:hypothetical protein [Myxococcus sp. CA040A]|uniref:hypothetical protein n=1 Tax=Myxococcus sp. CA040A TaxID=2741738 RepID=UPI00157A6480|nr:hypothetical protein [Myxococcus sp. CA040A]NTX06862.1 hypothetical protein [Myxococcus sp. CA040A]
MNVREALQRTKHWVDTEGSRIPGFLGAYVAGSSTRMPLDAPFAPWRDVDIVIATTDANEVRMPPLEFVHQEVIVECGCLDAKLFQRAEDIVATPEHADNLAAGVILSDPTGAFQKLHERVAVEFPRRPWVRARCEAHQRTFLTHLEQATQARAAGMYPLMLMHYHAALVYLSGLVALSHLRPITVRQCFVLSGELLERQGLGALHEESLELLGSASLSKAEVEHFHADFMRAFDRAIEVKRGDIPYGFKLRAHLRRAYLEGTQEMIDAGRHREAAFWFFGLYFLALMVIQKDAPGDERPVFQARFDAFFARLDLHPTADWMGRLRRAKAVFERFREASETALASTPAIKD